MSTIQAVQTPVSGELLPSRVRHYRLMEFCAWSGPFFIVAFLLAWAVLAGFCPPPNENWGLVRVAHYFRDNSVRIRIGMECTVFLSFVYLLWSMAIGRVMKRIEGPESTLSRIQEYGGLGTAFAIIFFSLLWLFASFRAGERDPQIIRMLNDAGWLSFDLVGAPTMAQMCALGVLVLSRRDPGDDTQFMPRWVAYLCFYVALTFLEVVLIAFLKTGPFAWHGLVTYYVILIGSFVWMAAVSYYVLRALKSFERQERAAALGATSTPPPRQPATPQYA